MGLLRLRLQQDEQRMVQPCCLVSSGLLSAEGESGQAVSVCCSLIKALTGHNVEGSVSVCSPSLFTNDSTV